MVHHANYQLHYHTLTLGVNDAFLLCRSNSLSLHSHPGGVRRSGCQPSHCRAAGGKTLQAAVGTVSSQGKLLGRNTTYRQCLLAAELSRPASPHVSVSSTDGG